MASTNETKVAGIPVPAEGTPEFEKMNRMARRAIPLVLIIFIFGILEQQAFGMIFVNIGQQLGTPELASLITSLPGIALGIVCVIYGSLGDFVSLKKMTLLGVIVFVIGSVIGFACGGMSIWFVVIARMLQSIGGQVAGSVFLVLVSKYVSQRERVVYYGIFVAVFRFSAALGVVAAGYITKLDWRWMFAIPHGSIVALAVAPCLYYYGTSFFYSPIVDTATLTVTPEESGRVLGANDLIQAITGSVGVAIFGQMMSAGVMSGGSIAGTEAGAASTYANVFLIGGVIVLSALVIFILTKKMIYSRSRKDGE